MTCTLCGVSFAGADHVRWVKDGYDIVRCPSCALLFRRELPTQQELDAIYGISYFKDTDGLATGYLDYLGDEDLHRQAARRRLSLLERVVPGRGRLLDVGAAAGIFVDEARAHGWDACGLDISEPMVRWGTETLHVPLERGTLSSYAAANDGTLDAVTMWDYIEHSIDPVGDVRRAHRLLKPGGVLGLSTGDAGTPVARASGSRWHLLTPEHHNFFFTAATLSRLLEENGFEIMSFDHRGSRYPVSYLVHKLRTLVDWSPLEPLTRRLAETRIGSATVPMNLWDIATVTARHAT